MLADPRIREAFNGLVGQLDYPMFIVTACSRHGELAGCLVGFAAQCSIDPPRWLVCLSKSNRTYRLGRSSRTLAVHFVPASAGALAERFGGQTGDEVDKFDGVGWEAGPDGVPLLDECRNCFAGRVLDRIDVGDHVAFVLEPIHVRAEVPQPEFTFHRARRIEAGHEA